MRMAMTTACESTLARSIELVSSRSEREEDRGGSACSRRPGRISTGLNGSDASRTGCACISTIERA